MLAKRPRLLQRNTSKMQLTPNDDFVAMPPVKVSQEKLIPLTPTSGAPRQVIGFNPVSSECFDAVASPSSVLSGVGSGLSQVKSPRSPHFGLGSLFSSIGFWEDKDFQGTGLLEDKTIAGVGLGIVATLSNDVAEGNPFRNQSKDTAKKLLPSPKQTEPIPISLPYLPFTLPSRENKIHLEMPNSCNDSFQSISPVWSFKGSQSCSNGASVCGAVIDVEMEICDSIFSTASPASSCSDNLSVSLLGIDFLNACCFCKCHLGPGKDIYMYRGDKAFCSTECRYHQIILDERKERCSASVSSSTFKPHGRLLTRTPAAA